MTGGNIRISSRKHQKISGSNTNKGLLFSGGARQAILSKKPLWEKVSHFSSKKPHRRHPLSAPFQTSSTVRISQPEKGYDEQDQ